MLDLAALEQHVTRACQRVLNWVQSELVFMQRGLIGEHRGLQATRTTPLTSFVR